MNNRDFTKYTIDAAIRLTLLLILGYWCFLIISPFVVILLWAVIISVAVYPLFSKLKTALGDRNKLAATVYTLVALAILITPTIMVSNSIIDTSSAISERYATGSIDIPPPPEGR